MTANVVTLRSTASVRDARNLLDAHGLKAVPVVDDEGVLRGSLKLSDVARAEKKDQDDATVKGFMKTQVHTVSPDTPLASLEEILVTTVGRVPVVDDDGRLQGIVTRTDLLRLRNYYGALPGPSAAGLGARAAGPG